MLFVPALYPIVLSHSTVGFKYIEAQPNYREQGCFDVFLFCWLWLFKVIAQ